MRIFRTIDRIESLLEANNILLQQVSHKISWLLAHHSFTVSIYQETQMALGNISAGSTGTFVAVLNDNGSPIALPTTSTFAWSSSDATVTFTESTDTTTVVALVPAGDLGTSVTITASTVGPDGITYSGSVTVALTPVAQAYTVTVTQSA